MRGFRSTSTSTSTSTAVSPDMDIYVRGPVDTATIAYAQAEVARAADTGLPVQHLKTKIAEYGERGRPPLCVAQVNVEVDGRLVRRQAAAPTIVQAIDRITAALPPALHRLTTHLSDRVGPPAFTGEQWQHNREPRPVPTYARPHRHPRGLVRHKACPLAVQNPAAAALTMDLRDYDFYLFTDDHDGQDRIVYRAGPTGYRMATVSATTATDRVADSPVVADSDPMPSLTLPEAIRRLDTSGRAFLIFAGAATTRGEILYRRYDGHLGLVTPIW